MLPGRAVLVLWHDSANDRRLLYMVFNLGETATHSPLRSSGRTLRRKKNRSACQVRWTIWSAGIERQMMEVCAVQAKPPIGFSHPRLSTPAPDSGKYVTKVRS